ncbi:AraC family transcriptional regulator [Salinisphaera aquimarina]|uniref:Helix-turn-helix domain-containing protein n=1 Tax=Salinisphaera aquimarina TaxID=2094031 RepID=A0ABV7ERG0_9GAMM
MSGRELVAWPWGDNALDDTDIALHDGFRLEEQRSREYLPMIPNAEWPRMQIALVIKGFFKTSYRVGLQSRHLDVGPGALFINPGGCEFQNIHPKGRFRMLLVEIHGRLLEQLTRDAESPTTREVVPQHNIRDASLARLIRTMESDLRRKCPVGRLYSEYLSLTLASYIIGRYAVRPKADRSASLLSRSQRARVTDFIYANIQCSLSLLDLASIAQLSPRHFSRLFRATFGESPHQYVIRLRIDQARELLAKDSTSISQIALSVGFGSQSHFTQIFHQATGVTPREYRLRGTRGPSA